jgi:hypothetical protein
VRSFGLSVDRPTTFQEARTEVFACLGGVHTLAVIGYL